MTPEPEKEQSTPSDSAVHPSNRQAVFDWAYHYGFVGLVLLGVATSIGFAGLEGFPRNGMDLTPMLFLGFCVWQAVKTRRAAVATPLSWSGQAMAVLSASLVLGVSGGLTWAMLGRF